MEQNDIVTKNFESYADVAADIVNALLHGGNGIVNGEEKKELEELLNFVRNFILVIKRR